MTQGNYEQDAAAAEAHARSLNAFAFDLYERISATDGNVFFSPYSIHQAMHMAFDGACGRTAEQMAEALRLQGAQKELAAIDLRNDEYGRPYPHEVRIANAIWGQSGYPLQEWYVDRLKRKHQAKLSQVDFANPIIAAKTISDWIEESTGGRIRNMITPDALHPLMRLMLTNAIYFRADWRKKFDPENTKPAPFHLNRNESIEVMMMHQMADFRIIQGPSFDVIALNYEGFGLCMYVLLPHRPEELPELEKTVLQDGPDVWSRYMISRRVDLYFPKFRLETTLALGSALAAIGMSDAFDASKADFSGISAQPGFFLSEVLHQTYVKADEEGTEAAGATAVELTTGPGGEDNEPIVLKIDRPFLFAITAQSHCAQALLFMGRMIRPTPVD